MPCYHPLTAYRGRRTSSGKSEILFDKSQALKVGSGLLIQLPCGQCVGYRLERSRQWAMRCHHEASLYQDNCFITLTYSDEHLPSDKSLHVDHFQKFMKRLRKRFGEGVRYYHCGEYGEKYMRPHYHACLFNFDFPDKKIWKENNGNRLYISESLSELWPFGFVTIGDVTFESAAYVARYIMKKVNGDLAESHYERVDWDTGEVYHLKPEYTTMSRRPGIGSNWFAKFKDDIFPQDYVVINGKKLKPPRFYDRCYELEYPSDFDTIKKKRVKNAKKHLDNNTPDRLNVREQVQLARLKRLPRSLD